jgi:hypothetical protein
MRIRVLSDLFSIVPRRVCSRKLRILRRGHTGFDGRDVCVGQTLGRRRPGRTEYSYGGVRFLGATLWTDFALDLARRPVRRNYCRGNASPAASTKHSSQVRWLLSDGAEPGVRSRVDARGPSEASDRPLEGSAVTSMVRAITKSRANSYLTRFGHLGVRKRGIDGRAIALSQDMAKPSCSGQVFAWREEFMLESRRRAPIIGVNTPILRALCWMQSCSERHGQPYCVKCT